MFKNKKHLFLGAALAAAIFITDWVTPAGLAVWIAYILVLAVVAKDLRPGQIAGAAGGLITLTYIGFFLESHAFGPAISLLNRTLGSAAIAILAYRIIKHRRADETLREMDENYRSLVENSPFGSYILQEDRLVYANKSLSRLVGYYGEELYSKNVLDFVHTEDKKYVREVLDKIKTGEAREINFEMRGIRKTGETFFANATGNAGLYGGKPAFLGRFFDITDRKRTEEALRQSEERLRLFVEEAPAAIAMLDTHMRYIAVSSQWLKNYGLDGQNIKGRSHYEVLPDVPERWREVHRRCLSGATERSEEDRFERADGRVQWVRWEIRPWRSVSGPIGGIIIFSEDITARKLAEEDRERLLASETAARAEAEEGKRLLDALMDNISEGIIIADAPDLKIRAASRRLLDLIDIDTYPEIANIEALKDKWAFYSHEGKPVPAGEMPLQRTASTGETIENEELFMADPDGGMKLISVNASPIRDGNGNITAVITSWRDVTGVRQAEELLFQALEREKEARAGAEEALAERRRAEDELKGSEERLRRALIELKELESARADFVSMLTHDLKSPLGTITGYAELLEGMCAEMPEAKGMVESIQRSAEKMLNMVQDFLAVSRLEDGRMKLSVKSEDLSAILDRIYGDFLPAAEKNGVKLEKDYGGLPRACVDARYIERSLGNLLQNALAHTPEGGRVVLKAESGAREGQRRRGPFIGFTVQDTGTGIPEDYRERIFDRYYTAAKSGAATGSGLGLAIVKAVAEAHGGRAAVESEPGKGSTFHIYMPLRSERMPN